MATTTTPAEVSESRPTSGRITRTSKAWPLSLFALAVFVFILYQWILPGTSDSVQTAVGNWMPLSAVNEAVLWVVFALGLNIVVGYSGLLDLGYVAFWAIGGYVAGWLMAPFAFQVTPAWKNLKFNFFGSPMAGQDQGIHLSFWLVLPIAAAICALQFFVNGENIGPNGRYNISNGSKGITPVDNIGTGPFRLIPGVPDSLGVFDLTGKFIVFAGLAAFCMFVSLRIREGRLGRAWLAIREDELAASMMGVPLMRTKLSAYAVGASFGGLGGVAYAAHVGGVLSDRFNFSVSITLLAMVVLGGMGNVWGVTVGALGLAWINSTGLAQGGDAFNSAFHTTVNFPSHNFLLFGGVLIGFMLFRREGLIPETRTRQILQEPERGEIESLGAEMEGTFEDSAAEGTHK
jgi:branched-chain amino acid transport system permease protein